MFLNKWYQIIFRNVTPFQCCNLVNYALLSDRNISINKNRGYSTFKDNKKKVNYYETLGLKKSATQSDVKTAYYKLSMEYHPDKNKGSEVAAEKFRDISEAYEVLGNFRLRRLYDKGIIHTAGSQFAHHVHRQTDNIEEEEEKDPETKFYKSRMKKSSVPPATGRTPIYDFDEWSRMHYGASFERRQAAKEKFDRQQRREQQYIMSLQKEMIIFGIVMVCIGFFVIVTSERKLDIDKTKMKRREEQKRDIS